MSGTSESHRSWRASEQVTVFLRHNKAPEKSIVLLFLGAKVLQGHLTVSIYY
jgi:hypothetical protein